MKTENLLENLKNELTPVKPLPSTFKRMGIVIIFMILGSGILFLFFSRRPDMAEVITHKPFIFSGIVLFLSWILASYSLSLLQLPTPHNRTYFLWGLSAVCILACSYLMTVVGSPNYLDGFKGGLNCSIDILFLSLLPLILLFIVMRRSAPTKFIFTGVNIALCCATLGAFLLQFSCPSENPAHLLLWHLTLPLASLVVVGALASTKILKW